MRSILMILIPFWLMVPVVVVAESSGFVVIDGDTLCLTPPIEVVGSRVPVSLPGLLRQVFWLSRADLDRGASRSIAEVLASVPEVEISQRQQYGVQGDLSIRGSTFEQVQMLLDGFDVGDPQTGHHNLNLPIGLGEVARIEVLPGHGSALYGANAVGGVVNVVSRSPSEDRGGEVEGTVGGFESRGGRAALESGTLAGPLGSSRVRVGAEAFETAGQHPGTDAEVRSLSLRADADGSLGHLDVLVGASRREFGALDFYAPYPSSERTDAAFGAVRLASPISDRVVIEPRVSFRRHEDHFVLFREDPSIYTNDHVSRRTTAELRSSVDAGYGLTFVFGAEGMVEDIASVGVRGGVSGPALGDHERRRRSGAIEVSGRHDRLDWSVGGRVDDWRNLETHGAASAALAWRPSRVITLRGSTGSVYRIPTFTELYYEDPVNIADPGLRPETGWTWDGALEARHGSWVLVSTVFARYEDDLIDWTKPAEAGDEPWRTRNITESETRGWSLAAVSETPQGHRLGVHLTGIRKTTSLPEGWQGKYVSSVPRRQVAAELSLRLPHQLRLTPQVRFRDLRGGTDHTVVDVRMSWERAPWRWRLDLTNVSDREYQEIPGLPMPGRLLSSSLMWSF